MGIAALSVKLRCGSWQQLAAIYERDLRRNALFLRSSRPPPLGTEIHVDLTLPSGTVIPLEGRVGKQVPPGPRGAGVELVIERIAPSTLWVIESALAAAKITVAPATPATVVLPSEDIPIDVAEEPEAADAEAELVAALERELAAFRVMNPFQVLQVGYDAREPALREAFANLSKKYHPDRFAPYESERARTLGAEIFILLRTAYRRAVDQVSRSGPLPRPPARPPPPPPAAREESGVPKLPLRPIDLQPENVLSIRKPEGTGAPSSWFEDVPAAAAAPPPVDLQPAADVSEADRLLDAGRYDEAFAAYELAIRQSPTDRAARVGRELAQAFRLLGQGDSAGATTRFEAALELDPMNERAARELAAIRRAATEARRGVLGRLLGKKG